MKEDFISWKKIYIDSWDENKFVKCDDDVGRVV